MKGNGVYKGKHWMQDPANKEKMLAMVRKMNRKGRRTKKIKKFQTIAKHITKAVRRSHPKPQAQAEPTKATSLVINGWKITLDKDEIRIDHE